MVLQLPCKELILVIACVNCLLIPYVSCKFVRCKLGAELDGHCSCRKISQYDTPWPKRDAPTAPKPRNASIKMKRVHGKLFPKIKWTLDKQYVEDVDGFYLEFWLKANFYRYYYCMYNDSMILKAFGKASEVGFKFENCCRSLSSGFHPGSEISVKIFSLPLYGADEETYYASAELTVVRGESTMDDTSDGEDFQPEEGRHVNHVDYPKTNRRANKGMKSFKDEMKRVEDLILDSSNNTTTAVIIAAVSIIVCLSLVFVAVHFVKRTSSSTQSMRKNRCILLVSNENEYGIKLANGFVEILKKSSNGEVAVISNVRRTSEIAAAGIVPWITENISNCSVVIMLINDPRQIKSAFSTQDNRKDVDLKKSPVSVALNVADSVAMKSNFRISKKKFILVHTDAHETKRLPFCTHYILRKHFKEMLKFVLGHRYDSSVDVKEDYNHVLDVIEKNVGEGVEKRPDVRRKTTKPDTNNLDVSFIPDQNGPRSDINDFSFTSPNHSSGYNSIENNDEVL